jgi:hypothetical protein
MKDLPPSDVEEDPGRLKVGVDGTPTIDGMTAQQLVDTIVNTDALTVQEKQILSKIQDPNQRAQQKLQFLYQKQQLLAQMLAQLVQMRFEALKAVVQNMRA